MNARTDNDGHEGHGVHSGHGAHAGDHDFTGPLSPGVARLLRGLFVLCAVLVALDFFVDRTTHAPGESLPGFYAAYGFVGCVVLVLAAKQMRKVVGKRPDHYEPTDAQDSSPERRDGEDPGC